MILMSLLLAALTFAPAMAPHPLGATEGIIQARAASPDATCPPGGICASTTVHRNACFYSNFWQKGVVGGTPLTIDVTQTGPQGSPTYLYWVNATNKNITITGGSTQAKFVCF
jgi:hypothetical protein